ncbi:SIMPL domain-containing protein [Thalassovita sp.]|uniref:SIMPL domain-containing protein n=1 Tax=Thalassovita sp. TaxID=1979401 RepID=UPI0029DE5E31|nr:SIMPL domain-containing protein [Thalassovita sp.]
MKRFALLIALGLAAMPAWGQETLRQLTVTGEGSVAAVPDMAMVSLGVVHQDRDAALAMARSSDATAAMLKRLTDLGIEPRDVQTSQVSLSPVYSGRESTGEPRIEGFRASLMLNLRVRDLDRLGAILGAVLADGANRFSGLQFGLIEPQPVEDAARKAAVADAMRKAVLYADAAGVKLGRVVSIHENGGGGVMPKMMAASERMADVPIAEGELNLAQSVTIVLELD